MIIIYSKYLCLPTLSFMVVFTHCRQKAIWVAGLRVPKGLRLCIQLLNNDILLLRFFLLTIIALFTTLQWISFSYPSIIEQVCDMEGVGLRPRIFLWLAKYFPQHGAKSRPKLSERTLVSLVSLLSLLLQNIRR